MAKASAAASSNPLTAVLGLPEIQGRLALAAAKDGSITLWGLPSASAEGESAELSAVASYEVRLNIFSLDRLPSFSLKIVL